MTTEQLEQQAVSPERLLDIIRFQTEVVQLGIDLGGVMALVAERSQFLTGAQGAVVELAEGDDMVYRAAAGIAEPQLGLRLKRERSLSGYCIAAGRPVYCEDSETDCRVDRDACRRVGLRSMIVAPLRQNDQVIGVLKVLSTKTAAFNEADIRVLELMTDLIAAAMDNAARYEAGEVFYRATHDALTTLPNRAYFYDHLRQRRAQAERAGERFAILILDMDGLKGINDTCGHRTGDAVIKEFATRIRKASRETDTAARIGGDEFGIIAYRVQQRDEIHRAMARLDKHISAPFLFEGRELPLAASMGAALYPDDATDIHLLTEKADQAMYEMKRHRKASALIV
jgi:diguanylate cyclase (GGDEF)-like protein